MSTLIIRNGGNPEGDCPKDWDEAKIVQSKLNEGKPEDDTVPRWAFDCGFKLDYDGPLLDISSRFYPPKSHYGPGWDGSVTVYLNGDGFFSKHFHCKTLDELQREVEAFQEQIVIRIQSALKDLE